MNWVRWKTGSVIALLIALQSAFVAAQDSAPATATRIPAPLADALTRAQIPLDAVSVVVKEVGASERLVSHNADKSMNPASVVKLLTTYAGLDLLGPAYSWKTDVLIAGDMRGAVLQGDLVFRGGADPKLTVERFWMLLKQLRERGLTTIRGDLVFDKTLFEASSYDPARFDGEPLKAYNVGPDPLLLHFKTVRFFFAPSVDGRTVSISPDVRPAQMDIINRVRLTETACGEWRDRILLDVQTPTSTQLKITFTGNYPRSCGERSWNISLLDHARFFGGAFASLWRELGGTWTGAVKLAATPTDAKLIATVESPALAEIVRDINKYSNNVMARQLFLSLSADATKEPREGASAARSTQVVREWLVRKGINAPELVLENGSGLSRIERLSASTLTQILESAWKSPVMPEYLASMPVLGVDGTFRRRGKNDAAVGFAHVKSGTLNDVRALAGFVLDQSGKRWIVVVMVNHTNAFATQAAQDALLQWVHSANTPKTIEAAK